MAEQQLFHITRKAERAALADRLCDHLARVEGVTVTREDEHAPYWDREIRNWDREIRITTSAAGVRCSFGLSGDSTWGVFANWNFDYQTRDSRLFSPEFQSLLSNAPERRPHHKATGPFMGSQDRRTAITETHADVFAAIINRAMHKVLDGSAFVQEVKS